MEKKRMNDKGFSLVELIIVIAIMAILIALLAPQYLKFVERSKKSADRDTVDQIIRTVQVDYADPESDYKVNGAKIEISTSGATITGNGLINVLKEAGLVSGAIDTTTTSITSDDIKLKSAQWVDASGSDVASVTIEFSYANENVVATVSDAYDSSDTSITGKSK